MQEPEQELREPARLKEVTLTQLDYDDFNKTSVEIAMDRVAEHRRMLRDQRVRAGIARIRTTHPAAGKAMVMLWDNYAVDATACPVSKQDGSFVVKVRSEPLLLEMLQDLSDGESTRESVRKSFKTKGYASVRVSRDPADFIEPVFEIRA
jgi:hypothetical protein